MSRRGETTRKDNELLAELGYKQEFKRGFAPLGVCSPHQCTVLTSVNGESQVFGLIFSAIGLFPSISSVIISMTRAFVSY